MDAAPTSGAVIVIEPCSKEYEHSDPTEECLPMITYPNLQGVPVGAEVGGDDATQIKKASKLHPRRRQGKTLEEVPETLSEADRQAVRKRKMKKEKKKQTDVANDHLSSFPNSMSLMDIREPAEAAPGIKARKRKKKTQETCSTSDCVSLAVDQSVDLTPVNMRNKTAIHRDRSVKLLGDKSSSCLVEVAPNQHYRSNTDIAVSGNLEDSALSDGENSQQRKEDAVASSETEEDSVTLASFLRQSRADRTRLSSAKVDNSPRKRKNSSQVHVGSSTAAVFVPNQLKRRRTRDRTYLNQIVEVEGGSRNDNKACRNQSLEVEAGDDTTLAHFYNRLKKRRTESPKIRHLSQ